MSKWVVLLRDIEECTPVGFLDFIPDDLYPYLKANEWGEDGNPICYEIENVRCFQNTDRYELAKIESIVFPEAPDLNIITQVLRQALFKLS